MKRLRKNLPYLPLRDFAPVSLLAKMSNVLVVSNAFPAKTVAEFIAHAKANPGKVSYGSSGVGAAPHLSMELFSLRKPNTKAPKPLTTEYTEYTERSARGFFRVFRMFRG